LFADTEHHSEGNLFLQNLIMFNLLILLVSVSLFNYKCIYNFRVNQEFYLKLFVLIASFLWILKIINNHRMEWRKCRLNFPIILFILVMSTYLIISKNLSVSLNDCIIFLAYFLIYFLILNNLNSEKQFQYFIKTFFILSFLVAVYAIIQYYSFDPYFDFNNSNTITSTIG